MADNKSVVQRMFGEVVNEGRIDLVDELFDPEFETTTPQGVLDREGFKEFVRGWRAAFSDIHCEVHDVIAEGDSVAWGVRAVGTNDGEFMGMPATGRKVDFDSLNLAHFRDGRSYRHTVMMDLATMMAQLGVPAGAPA